MSVTEEVVRSRQEPGAEEAQPRPGAPEVGPPGDGGGPPGGGGGPSGQPAEAEARDRGPAFRPLVAAALTSAAAGLMTGGIFGVWPARLLAGAAAVAGVGWAWVSLRQRRAVVYQAATPLIAILAGALTLVVGSDPALLPELVAQAVRDGRLLEPPVPFDPGWRPVLTVLFFMLGFAAAWVAAGLDRPQLALVLPLPVVGLTAISQPAEGEVVIALLAFIPILGALAVLFGGDARGAAQLTSQFELKRAVRGVLFAIPAILLVFGLSRADFLFPEPIYDPTEQPQEPQSVPLSEVEDRVLFEIEAEDFTGPWRTGVMDVYQETGWRVPPFDDARYERLPEDGTVDSGRPNDVTVRFHVRDLGATPTFPGVATPTRFELIESPEPMDVLFDPRTDTFRVREGRVEEDSVYEMSLPEYPGEDMLQNAQPARDVGEHATEIPDPPPAVEELLAEAPSQPWARLDFLRDEMFEVAVAAGAGQPEDVPPSKVQDILAGSNEATPFELVAAEAMLARWAGFPSRIGFGFDGFNEEDGALTIRPRNGASWLEVNFEGLGWVPLIATPQQAQETLDADDVQRDVEIEPSDDVAVEVYVPIERQDIVLLYERIRAELLYWLPWVLLGTGLYLSWPATMRTVRRWRRRNWARVHGPRARIAVEYAELRDLAMDLTVGDPYDTPLEYLDRVQDDPEHEEFAWLVTRAMYGDLAVNATDEDAHNAEVMSASLRRRLFRAQPVQSRILAVLSRASLRLPYTTEVPSVPRIEMPRPPIGRANGVRRRRHRRHGVRRALRLRGS